MSKNIMMGDSSEFFKNRYDVFLHQTGHFVPNVHEKIM